jgi:uncharacterized protein (DUF2235 family)
VNTQLQIGNKIWQNTILCLEAGIMKRLVFCFDGTWNKIESEFPTNVARIAQSVSRIDGEVPQIVHYDEGVGTNDFGKILGKIGSIAGGAFGLGLKENIIEAYTFLVFNYEPGDQIYVFGFSRGAFTARSFCGLIRNAGIVDRRNIHSIRDAVNLYVSRESDDSPDERKAREFRYNHCTSNCIESDLEWLDNQYPDDDHSSKVPLRIEYLGVWDTVGALGVPMMGSVTAAINDDFEFHDTELDTFVHSARHAIAADEKRNTFAPTTWSNIDQLRRDHPNRYDEKIFPGTHSSVGGGGPVRGLSDIALEWIYEGAKDAKLAFDTDKGSPIYELRPFPYASLHNQTGKTDWTLGDRLMGAGLGFRKLDRLSIEDIHPSVIHRWHDPKGIERVDGKYRPFALEDIWKDIVNQKEEFKFDPKNEIFDGILDEENGLLMAPNFTRSHLVTPADVSLMKVAEDYYESRDKWLLIYWFNKQIGRLFEPHKFYAGTEILIPFYDVETAVED